MPLENLKAIQVEQSNQAQRITNLEEHIREVMPPLLEKFDNNANQMHELCLSINDLTNKIGAQSERTEMQAKEYEKLDRKVDKMSDKHNTLREEVVENRMLAKAVKSLGAKLAWSALAIMGAAVSIIIYAKA